MVRSTLRKTWIHDSLLKIRTKEDMRQEVHDNRTVIIDGLPRHLRAEQILSYYGHRSGTVTAIEMPV